MASTPNTKAVQQIELEDSFIQELLQEGTIEPAASPSKPASKKTKRHTIPIHTEIEVKGAHHQETEIGRAQGQFNNILNFSQ